MKLIKTTAARWAGNGMGTDSAQYSVDGYPNIIVLNRGRGAPDWCAIDTETNTKVIRPFGWTLKEVKVMLDERLTDEA